jgi:hypothetical protein
VVNPLLNNESLQSTPLRAPELVENVLELLVVMDLVDHMAFATGISFQQKWEGKRRTSLMEWKLFSILSDILKYASVGVRNAKFAED